MEREHKSTLERLLSKGQKAVNVGKRHFVKTALSAGFLVGGCGSGNNNGVPVNENSGGNNVVDEGEVVAKEYRDSVGFYIPEGISPENAGDDIVSIVEKIGIKVLKDYIALPGWVGVVEEFFSHVGGAGVAETFDFYVKKRNDTNWKKRIEVREGESFLTALAYDAGFELVYSNGIKAEIIDKTGLLDEDVGDIYFLHPNEEEGLPPNFFVSKREMEFSDPPDLDILNDSTFEIGGYGDSAMVIVKGERNSNDGGNNGGNQGGGGNSGNLTMRETEDNSPESRANELRFEGNTARVGGTLYESDIRPDHDYFSFQGRAGDTIEVSWRADRGNLNGFIDMHYLKEVGLGDIRRAPVVDIDNPPVFRNSIDFSVRLPENEEYFIALGQCFGNGCSDEREVPYTLTVTKR